MSEDETGPFSSSSTHPNVSTFSSNSSSSWRSLICWFLSMLFFSPLRLLFRYVLSTTPALFRPPLVFVLTHRSGAAQPVVFPAVLSSHCIVYLNYSSIAYNVMRCGSKRNGRITNGKRGWHSPCSRCRDSGLVDLRGVIRSGMLPRLSFARRSTAAGQIHKSATTHPVGSLSATPNQTGAPRPSSLCRIPDYAESTMLRPRPYGAGNRGMRHSLAHAINDSIGIELEQSHRT